MDCATVFFPDQCPITGRRTACGQMFPGRHATHLAKRHAGVRVFFRGKIFKFIFDLCSVWPVEDILVFSDTSVGFVRCCAKKKSVAFLLFADKGVGCLILIMMS